MDRTESAGVAPPPRAAGGTAGFAEPWQAQLLALADTLVQGGVFTPAAWSEALGAALRRANASGAPDTAETYYAAALEALESLLTQHGLVTPDSLARRREAWRQAHRTTPHGRPVELPGVRSPAAGENG